MFRERVFIVVKTYKMSDFQKVVIKKFPPPPCDTTMKVTIHEASDGVAHGSWQVDRSYLNGNGVAMGGFLSSAADIVMAYAISSKLTDCQGFASINLDTTFHRPTVEGKVDVSAVVESQGRTLAYVVAELKQHNKKVATCTSSLFIEQREE